MRRGRIITAAGLAPLALLLLAAGCVPEPAFDNDPLLGGRPLPRNGSPTAPAASGVAAAPKPADGPLQLPPPGPVSPAALATGNAPAADASGLRIGPAPGALASAPSNNADAWHGSAGNSGATLKPPEAIADGSVKPIAVIAPPTAGVGPPPPVPAPYAGPAAPPAPPVADGYAQLQELLAMRGVLYQQLTGPDDKGVWRFSCAVPRVDGQAGDHMCEASAPGEGGLAAVRAALAKIDQYQSQGPAH